MTIPTKQLTRASEYDLPEKTVFPKDYDKSDPTHENGVQRENGRWACNQTGNPKGRPHDTGSRQNFRKLLDEHGEDIIMSIITKAKEGDSSAMGLCMKRLLPELKADDKPIEDTEQEAPLIITTT